MLLTPANLAGIFSGYSMAFNTGFTGLETAWPRIAMKVNSASGDETYGWLKDIPNMREWLGPRVVWNLAAAGYTVTNKWFELTIGVPRDKIEDDSYGLYAPMLQEMGRSAAEHPDKLLFDLLTNGFSRNCYDGQYFFDVDHPVIQEDGSTTVSVSNMQAGSGAPWFLLDTTRAIRPLVYQERRPFQLVSKDRPEDENVFNNKEFVYGVDGRCNAGYGLWQLAFGSKATLDPTNYKAARTAMTTLRGDFDRRLGIKPTVLICGPENESAARKLLNSEYGSGGETNEWKGTAELIVTPWIG